MGFAHSSLEPDGEKYVLKSALGHLRDCSGHCDRVKIHLLRTFFDMPVLVPIPGFRIDAVDEEASEH